MSRKHKKSKAHRKHREGQQNVTTTSPSHRPVGLFVTKELATAIEACKKKVESIATECRAKNIKFRDREFDLHYDPFRCLHGYTDFVDCSTKDVQRVTEIFDAPHFFPEGGAITSNAIRQGDLGDCYFLSALATVSCIPNLIEKICVARDEEIGVYGFIFYRDSGWTSVIIDDMLFTNIPKFEELDTSAKAIYHQDKANYDAVARKGGSTLLFARAGSQDETWVPLIEKAYAKLYGNFAHLEGGFTSESVEDLTGGVSTVFISKDILNTDKFWTDELAHVNEDRVFACGFMSLKAPMDDPSGQAPAVEGLYGNHAYSILRAMECKGKRFLVVRNPWGNSEWTGRWSDGAKEWTPEWLEILPQLGHTFGNDGQFIMEYKDFLRCFETIQKTFLFDDSWVVSSVWLAVPLNDHPRAWAYGALSYLVTIPAKSKTIFVLSRLNDRSFRSIKQATMISLEFVVVRLGNPEPIASACEWRPFSARSVTLELDLEPGTYALYVRFDREVDGETSPPCTCCPPPAPVINTSARVISRILSNKVGSQAIADNWDSKMKAVFIAKSLEQVIADDYEQLSVMFGGANKEDAEKPTESEEPSEDIKKTKGADVMNGNGPSKEDNIPTMIQVDGDVKVGTPGDFPEVDKAPLSLSNFEWDIMLKLFAIGCLNILALFSLAIISALEASKAGPKHEESSRDVDQDPEADSEAKEGEGKEDQAATEDDDRSVSSPSPEAPGPSGGPPMEDWQDLLKDDGKNIFLGLRVYTQTEEPALVTGRVKCEGPELCVCK